MRADAVLLLAFGGPTRPEEIRPFLENVTRGRRIPPERLDAVAHHYELIGGRSPLNELTVRHAEAPVVFTAHSIPTASAAQSPYVRELGETAAAIAAAAGVARWQLAYQSRSGSPRDPWLEPDVNDALRALAADGVRDVVVAPIGFVCDHVEVLYDLDVEARQTADGLGMRCARAGTGGDHPAFGPALADVA